MHTLIIPHRDLANWLLFCAAYGAELVGVDTRPWISSWTAR